MFCLNSRQIDIIESIVNKYNPVSIKEIASKYGVSTRTIRYDLELIDSWLKENKATLVKIPRKGVMIKALSNHDILLDKLKFLSVKNRVLSDKERIKYITLELLTSRKPLTIENLSDKLLLSRNTIIKSLKGVKKFLQDYGLKLSKETRNGFYITGDERCIRKILLSIFLDVLESENLTKYLREENKCRVISDYIPSYNNFIQIGELVKLSKFLIEAEEKNNYYLTDIDFVKLILYMEILIRRIEQEKTIKETNDTLQKTIEYTIASELAQKISIYKNFKVSNDEVKELTKYIIGFKSFNTINELKRISVEEIADRKTIQCAEKLITFIEELINIKIKDDRLLFNGLVLHLKSALTRIQNNDQIKNKYLDEIKSNYPFVYQAVKESIKKMRGEFSNQISDDEIAYITLHIRAAYERIIERSKKFVALLVCPEGISFLSILSTKIKKEIPELKLVETCSVYDYEQLKEDIDFIISTKPLDIYERDVVVVSPFLSNDDVYKIKQLIIQLSKFRIVYKYNLKRKGMKTFMLKDILDPGGIQLQVEVNGWEDAVRKAGSILVNQGKVKQAYVENMIKAIKDLGPYIVVMPGVAFAHARPDASVIETCVSMITLANPVNFGSKQNDPVHIVFAFAAQSGEEHLKALQDLAKFLSVEKNIKFLMHSNSVNEVYKRIVGK